MGLVVKKPGICSTVQDLGRIGYQGSGFTPSGVMDRRAAVLANLLVDNRPQDPVIEFMLTGATVRFTTNTVIAVTGADFSPMLGGKPIPMYKAIVVHRGSILSFGAPKCGTYSYLAVAGGSVRIPSIMGSFSTNLKCGVGGWRGRKLIVGDYLPFTTKTVEFLPSLGSHNIPRDDIYEWDNDEVELRAVPGPQEDLFTRKGIDTFYSKSYSLTNQCDRMGYRLEGDEIETKHGSDIISDGIAFGAVQIPSHGRPIIMLADRQTTGGYAKIATVATVDIPKLVQRRMGERVRFRAITVEEAQELYREEAKWLARIAKKVILPCADGISPRRTARKLMPILEKQAQAATEDILWIQR